MSPHHTTLKALFTKATLNNEKYRIANDAFQRNTVTLSQMKSMLTISSPSFASPFAPPKDELKIDTLCSILFICFTTASLPPPFRLSVSPRVCLLYLVARGKIALTQPN